MGVAALLADGFARELLLFAGIWIAVGLVDELAIDLCWVICRLRGRGRALRFIPPDRSSPAAHAAVLVPCWSEAAVIRTTLAGMCAAWPRPELRIFVGCYPNDPGTVAEVRDAAARDARIRLVLVEHPGPTTKADCLNALYRAVRAEMPECRFALLHDAEDHVHPDALALIEDRLQRADFVQIPVRPLIDPRSRWIAGHYADEFAESHEKTMVVRDWLFASMPAAGVGCAFRIELLEKLARQRGADAPFSPQSLTEDYVLGLLADEIGASARFVRATDENGDLICTREYFPHRLDAAVRQKSRWLHGIAFQGWDELGWRGRATETWMRMRDRRGPLTALVLIAAYLQIVLFGFVLAAETAGLYQPAPLTSALRAVIVLGLIGLVYRTLVRAAFVARVYGPAEGLRAIPRQIVANYITILSARRAIAGYVKSLRGSSPRWDKTEHDLHPLQQGGALS